MKTYRIEPSGSGKIAASLCRRCQPGQIGEPLIRNGCTQSAFALFVARLAAEQLVEKGKTPEQLAEVFDLVSACNASAAKQALAQCNLFAEELCIVDKAGKMQPIVLETYWKTIGGGKAAPNLSALD
jgi:hypothetical protein